MHPGGQFARQRAATDLGQHRGDVGLGDRPAATARPQAAHHVVERAGALAAQRQVERQRDQRALGVVADRGVDGVLVGPVVLDPGVEARLGHALHRAPRRAAHVVDGLGQQLEVACLVDQAGTPQHQVVVVGREALEEPQQLGVVLARVVVALEVARPHPLDVPGVEVLVADQAQQRHVAVGRRLHAVARQVAAVGDQRGAGAVLQAAVAVVHRVEQKDVALERRLLAAVPEGDLRLADAPGVGQQALAVEAGQHSGHDELVRHPRRLEAAAPEAAQLHRVVDQFVVAGRLVVRAGERQRCCDLPAPGQPGDPQPVRLVLASVHAQEHAGAVEEAAPGIEVGRTHRGVEGVDHVAHHQRATAAAVRHPAGLVALDQGHGAIALARLELGQVAGELPHQVAARNPHRQAQRLLFGRLRDGEGDAELVGQGVGHLEAVTDHRELGSGRR
ncbi:hypothetical protein X551_04348 [Methylibium sp. T29]|nr:hypothetical protein X551_04348 [Methylibium sp. T29]EWS57538.1 hypothetical protein Y694_04481 [Methylibium sp. T29-B]